MKLLLVRHAETIENAKGIIQGHLHGNLSEKGIFQARKLAIRLQKDIIDTVYCSDLQRAVDTSNEIVVFHKKINVNFTNKLREVDMGVNQGKTKKELNWIKDFNTNYTPPKGGESTEQLYDRAERFLKYLSNNYSDKTVLVISHGGTIKAFIAVMTNVSKAKVFSVEHQKNTGLTIIDIENNNYNFILKNDIKHLKNSE